MTDIWPLIHAERKALAADLEGLTEAQWASPSLCTEWTIRDVVAHMTATAKMTPAKFPVKLVKSGFSLKKMQARDIAAELGGSAADTLSRFKSVLTATTSPPGPKATWLGEVLVHSEDIRRPLGISRQYPSEATTQVAQFYQGSNLIIGAKKRIAGLTLSATDTTWAHGSGAAVSGPIASIILGMTGRKAGLDDLTGEGVDVLRGRP